VQLHLRSVQRWRRRWATGDFSLEDEPGRGRKAIFPPLDQALVKAVACELIAETKQPPSRQSLAYRSGAWLFWMVDNGSSPRGAAAKERLRQMDSRIMLVHTPVHASWLHHVDIDFSIIPRQVLTPNDVADMEAIQFRLALYEDLANQSPPPFQWTFDCTKLPAWLARIEARQMALAEAHCTLIEEVESPVIIVETEH
jgi:hypothetical protein